MDIVNIWFRGLALLHSCMWDIYMVFWYWKAYWTSYKSLTDEHIFNEDLIVSWIKISYGACTSFEYKGLYVTYICDTHIIAMLHSNFSTSCGNPLGLGHLKFYKSTSKNFTICPNFVLFLFF